MTRGLFLFLFLKFIGLTPTAGNNSSDNLDIHDRTRYKLRYV